MEEVSYLIGILESENSFLEAGRFDALEGAAASKRTSLNAVLQGKEPMELQDRERLTQALAENRRLLAVAIRIQSKIVETLAAAVCDGSSFRYGGAPKYPGAPRGWSVARSL